MKKLIKMGLISSLVFTSMVMANTLNLNLEVGAAFSQLSNNAAVMPVEGLVNFYAANEGIQSAFFAEVGPEYVFDHLTTMPFTLGLGLSAYYVDLGAVSGTEIPGANLGLTDMLNYSLQANSVGFMFEPRVTYTAYCLQPYALAGVGYASNTLNTFSENTPTGSNAVPSNSYGSNTEGSVAYEFGAGIQYPLITNLLLRLEYRYLNLGNAELGAASGQTTGEHLSSSDISTNIVDLGFSYQF